MQRSGINASFCNATLLYTIPIPSTPRQTEDYCSLKNAIMELTCHILKFPFKYRDHEVNVSNFLLIIGERSEPHTYRTVGKNLRHIYIYKDRKNI